MSENPFSPPSTITISERPTFWRAIRRGLLRGGLVAGCIWLVFAIAVVAVAYTHNAAAIPHLIEDLSQGMPGAAMLGATIGSLVSLVQRWLLSPRPSDDPSTKEQSPR